MDQASICIVLEKSYPYQDEFDASLKGILKEIVKEIPNF